MGRGRSRIIVTELPYQTNKSALIERIAELSRGGQLDGLSDLRDESDRQGMRIVIELARTADPSKVLAALYQRTPMQTTFGISMLALVDDEPRTLSLKQALRVTRPPPRSHPMAQPIRARAGAGGRTSWPGCASPWDTSTKSFSSSAPPTTLIRRLRR
jgi:hypothetical protein